MLGTWTCAGTFVGDGAHTETGVWVITRQTYEFADGGGSDLLVTQGPELADEGIPFTRAVTGGTGSFAGAPPEIRQIFLGFNEYGGVKLRYDLGDGA